DDPDRLLAITAAKAKLGRTEEVINDQDIVVDAVVDDLRLAIGAKNEDRRHLALHDAARENDIDAAAIIEDRDRTPWRAVAGQTVAVVTRGFLGDDRRGRRSLPLPGWWRRIGPGNRRHIERLASPQFNHIGAPVGGDDKIGRNLRPRRLDQNMHLRGIARPAYRIADNPAGGVTRCN